jgi:hypothetical protein
MVRSLQPLVRASVAAALLWAATGASAQLAVYKNVNPDGPAADTERTEIAPPSPPNGAEADAPAAAPKKYRYIVPARLAAQVNASEAKRRLEQAERKRMLGEDPLAGERIPAVHGVAVNSRYWRRQEKLRIEVDQAQRRVDATQRPLLATR